MTVLDRRRALKAGGLAALSLLLSPELLAACTNATAPTAAESGKTHFLFFTEHEAAVVTEATARLIPGPEDDPAEAGHPGAREANVTRYIDTLLGALSLSPQKIFAGGPFSDRAGWKTDDMARFIGLAPVESWAWHKRIGAWQEQYRTGVVNLDKAAGGSFLQAHNSVRDEVLAKDEGGFATLLFSHAAEGMYSNPEYGGNEHLVGWRDISFPGDVQPRGYTPAEVSRSDGPDPYHPSGIGAALVGLIKGSNGV